MISGFQLSVLRSSQLSAISFSMRWLTFHFSLFTLNFFSALGTRHIFLVFSYQFFSALTCDFIFHCLINHFYNENPLYITFIINVLQRYQNTPWTKLVCEKCCLAWSSNLVTFTLNEAWFKSKPRQYFFEPNVVQGGLMPHKYLCLILRRYLHRSKLTSLIL